jgi:hypothetical protein
MGEEGIKKQAIIVVGNYTLNITPEEMVKLEEIRIPQSAVGLMPKEKWERIKENIRKFVIDTKKESPPYFITAIVWYDDPETMEYVMKIVYAGDMQDEKVIKNIDVDRERVDSSGDDI